MNADWFIYPGLGILLLGAIFGFYVAYKGYRSTDWSNLKRISSRAVFFRGEPTPSMKKLIRTWMIIMIAGFILLAIGISIGTN